MPQHPFTVLELIFSLAAFAAMMASGAVLSERIV
jgi:hypothetical protein